MKKLLFIDPLCPRGHVGFNNIYLNALDRINNIEISTAFYNDYYHYLNINDNCNRIVIPDLNLNKIKYIGKIINRIKMFKYFYNLNKLIDFKSYDIIFFSSFDNIGFLFANYKNKNTYLIIHNNIFYAAKSMVHKSILKIISRYYNYIVFDEINYNFLKKLNIDNTSIIPHGLRVKFIPNNTKTPENFIFIPSLKFTDLNYVLNLINNEQIENILVNNNAYIIINGFGETSYSRIVFTNKFLKDEEYSNYFVNSRAIYITYSNRFKNRTSGIFMEAIANEKLLILNKIDYFTKQINGKNSFYINNINELINSIENIFNLDIKVNYKEFFLYNSVENISNEFNKLINK